MKISKFLESTIFLVFILFIGYNLHAQKLSIDNNNRQLSYEELEDSIWNNYPDFSRSIPFAQTYLIKAKLKNDSIKIAKAFDFLARMYRPQKNIKYADSVILFSKNIYNKNYPAVGYSLKGYWNYQLGNYMEALDAYLLAFDLAKKNNNVNQIIESGEAIASLKNRWGGHKDALKIYKEHLVLVENQANYKNDLRSHYLSTLYNLNISYKRNNHFDSSSIYIERGIKESLKVKDTIMYYNFIFSSGINLFYQKDYRRAEDSLNKAKPFLDKSNLAIYYLYKGMLFNKKDEFLNAEIAFKKSDSIYELTEDLFPELRLVYQKLVERYKKKKDLKNQLIYLNKLLIVDSLLNINKNYLNMEIIKNYDIPALKEEKNKLQLSLKKKTENYDSMLLLGFFLLVVLTSISIIQNRRKRKFQLKFKELMEIKDLEFNNDSNTIPFDSLKGKTLSGISKEIVDEILEKLELFEKKLDFIDKDLKLSTLSKSFSTNSSYLSKTINFKKNKNFSQYLKDLRISYSINLLKGNSKIRNYTIAAIADEVGFKSPESFSKAFYERTGIYPSYFIKELNKAKS